MSSVLTTVMAIFALMTLATAHAQTNLCAELFPPKVGSFKGLRGVTKITGPKSIAVDNSFLISKLSFDKAQQLWSGKIEIEGWQFFEIGPKPWDILVSREGGEFRLGDGPGMTLLEKNGKNSFQVMQDSSKKVNALAYAVSTYLTAMGIKNTNSLELDDPLKNIQLPKETKKFRPKPMVSLEGDPKGPWLSRLAFAYKERYGVTIAIDTSLGVTDHTRLGYAHFNTAIISANTLIGSPRKIMSTLAHELTHSRQGKVMINGAESQIFRPGFVPTIELHARKGILLEEWGLYENFFRLDEVIAHEISSKVEQKPYDYGVFARKFHQLAPKILEKITSGEFDFQFESDIHRMLYDLKSEYFAENRNIKESDSPRHKFKLMMTDDSGAKIEVVFPINIDYFINRDIDNKEVVKDYLLRLMNQALSSTERFVK